MALVCGKSANKATESNFASTIYPLGGPFSIDSVITPPNLGSIGDVATETPVRLPQPNRKRKKDSPASVLTVYS